MLMKPQWRDSSGGCGLFVCVPTPSVEVLCNCFRGYSLFARKTAIFIFPAAISFNNKTWERKLTHRFIEKIVILNTQSLPRGKQQPAATRPLLQATQAPQSRREATPRERRWCFRKEPTPRCFFAGLCNPRHRSPTRSLFHFYSR